MGGFRDTDWTLAMDGGLAEGRVSRNSVPKSTSQHERVETSSETEQRSSTPTAVARLARRLPVSAAVAPGVLLLDAGVVPLAPPRRQRHGED